MCKKCPHFCGHGAVLRVIFCRQLCEHFAFKQLSIRGEDNGRCLLLVDGQKITENSGMNGAPLLISVQDIERVEVVKGPASVLYGSEAIGGVVNVITKKGPKEDGAHGSVGVRGDTGTHGIDQYYSLSGRFGDFSARVSYSDEDHGNIEAPGGAIDDTDYRIQNTSAWLAYDLSENAKTAEVMVEKENNEKEK